MGIIDKVTEAVTSAAEKVAEAVGLKSADGSGKDQETTARPPLRTIRGVVASDKGNKTIKVVVNYQTRHQKYGKYLKRRTVLHAHDEKNEAHEGDTVEVAECRPLSKTKHHRLVRIVDRAPERAVQVSAEEVMTGKAPEER
jgi:small subunit ribosomal protein S17